MAKYKITSNEKGRRIYAEDYRKMKYRSLRYITPKGYKIKKINKKDQLIEFEKI
jgi:hypothetical protein